MKTAYLLSSILMASAYTSYAQETTGNAEALNDKYGFRDAHFESPVTAFKGLTLVTPGKLTKAYTRQGDSKKIGGAEVSKIIYYFYKGKLSSVALIAKGLHNSHALLDALVAQYGQAEQPNEYIPKYYWDATRVSMAYDENSVTNDAIVVISSKPLSWQEKQDNEQAAKKAGSDL